MAKQLTDDAIDNILSQLVDLVEDRFNVNMDDDENFGVIWNEARLFLEPYSNGDRNFN